MKNIAYNTKKGIQMLTEKKFGFKYVPPANFEKDPRYVRF